MKDMGWKREVIRFVVILLAAAVLFAALHSVIGWP